jgi:putative redox-active protein with C_GCAxxG_C_C motif
MAEKTRTGEGRARANLLRMGHCAPAIMQTLVDVNPSGPAKTENEWLVKLAAGMPGGIGNTGFECGGVTSPLVMLGLRHGLAETRKGLPVILDRGHDLCRRFVGCNGTLLCSKIRGTSRVPTRCSGVVRRSPRLYEEAASSESLDAIPGQTRDAYVRLYAHFTGSGFHCAHAVFQRLQDTVPIRQEVFDGTAGFLGGTLLRGMTCSAFTAGVMAVGLRIGEIETSRLRVLRMIALMIIGGNALADPVNKFNRAMNTGNKMSEWFVHEYGSTQCHTITQCDFSTQVGVSRYIESDCLATCRAMAERVAAKVQSVIEEVEARELGPDFNDRSN